MAYSYDYIILGAGAAGLSLAYYMSSYPALQEKRVLIIDKDTKNQNDRTWTFWGTPPADLAHLIKKSWQRVGIFDHQHSVEADISELQYHYISGDAFYKHTRETISKRSNYSFLRAMINEVDTTGDWPVVKADGVSYTAPYIFNSAYFGTGNLHNIKDHIAFQRFSGWEVVYDEPVLDADKLTLMDFSMNSASDLRFIYVLPLAENRLIINSTAFGRTPIPNEFYGYSMAEYLHKRISKKPYEIVRQEGGMIPMSHLPIQRYYGETVINLGIMGGDTRASTGYTFIHTLENAQHLAGKLAKGETPIALEQKPRHAFYDRIFLQVLAEHPKKLEQGLVALFRKNRPDQVFRFLSGKTVLYEELPLILSLPIAPFVKGLLNMVKKPVIPYAGGYHLSKARH